MARSRRTPRGSLEQAFDEIRFGREHTLNLRERLPTVADAVARTEAWLRQQQIEKATEVLVITGRGNQSPDGVSPVREAVVRLFSSLKRRGVIASQAEHTPGSFVVELAPVRALWDSPKRKRDHSKPLASPPSLDLLAADTRALLRRLAEYSLDTLGVADRDAFLEGEMLRQFGALAAGVPEGPDREQRLCAAIRVALDEYE
ncbi:MAG TPA: hypothetical protein VIC55_03305 [Gemmatimonadaceae bacterium]